MRRAFSGSTMRRMLGGSFAVLWSSSIVRSAGILVGGTAAGHLITVGVMPLTTRLFSPHEFGIAATFASLVGMVVAASCLRFDMAIALPDNDVEAINVLAVSIASALAVAVGVATVLALLPPGTIELFGQPELAPLLGLAPVAIAMGGSYLALQMWFVRRSNFRAIAHSRVIQSASAATGQLTLGGLGVGPLGLIVGQILNTGGGSITLGALLVRRHRALLSSVTSLRMRAVFRKYDKFPRYSVGEALANAASIHLPILVIAALSQSSEIGYLSLGIFLLQAPMALVGNSVGQAYLAEAPDAHRAGRLGDLTARIARGLCRTVAVPMAATAVLAPIVFGTVFGAPWSRSGVLVAWMAPWFALQFITSPISTALHVDGRQRVAMLLQFLGLLLRLGAVAAAAYGSLGGVSEAYAISGAGFYLVYLLVMLRLMGVSHAKVARLLAELVALGACGALIGFFARFLLISMGL